MRFSRFVFLMLLFSSAAIVLTGCDEAAREPRAEPDDGRVSRFGEYEGYSEARFNETVRSSVYVTVRDGTRLAVDVVRPAVEGSAVDEPLPVIWTHSRYHRSRLIPASSEGGDGPQEEQVASFADFSPDLQRLMKHGYVFVSVGVRGSGASFGRYEGLFSPNETRDAYDIIDWISKQPWCDGNIGMWGGSYLGITQYMAASTGHPALKAIFPIVAFFDFYEVIYPGGIYRDDLIEQWGLLTRSLDVNVQAPTVDADPDGALRGAAVEEHQGNWDVIDELRKARYRDHDTDSFAYSRHNPAEFLDEINASGVAAYHWGGWFDTFALDEILWYANYEGPQRLTLGPWAHSPQGASAEELFRLIPAEAHRWFDHWLKGIDNGVMDDEPIRYAVMDDTESWTWRSATQWPPAGAQNARFYLSAGPSGSVDSVNDGSLVTDSTGAKAAFDEYQVDPATTTGTASRWDNAVGQGPMVYPDMSANDARALTYTTEPLPEDLTVVGHPVITLHATVSASDADFYVLLEEVDATGASHYITEGLLRATQRTVTEAPWNNLGLPFQRVNSGDAVALPVGPVELTFDLIPTAQLFNAGNRLRVTITGADADNTEEAPVSGSVTFKIHRGPEHPSSILLPVLDEDS